MTWKFKALHSDTPYTACKYGIVEREGYLDCKNCAYTQQCDIFQNEVSRFLVDDYVEKFIKKPKAKDYQYWLQDRNCHYYFDADLKKAVEKNSAPKEKNIYCTPRGWKKIFEKVADLFDKIFK